MALVRNHFCWSMSALLTQPYTKTPLLCYHPSFRDVQSLTGSKDLQMVSITLRVLTKPDPSKLPFIYRRLGKGEHPHACFASRRVATALTTFEGFFLVGVVLVLDLVCWI